jgi:hypothetical protein
MIFIKRHQASEVAGPKIVFLGGSSVLFGIDATMVETALHVPVMNYGLHAGMRLPWLLAEAKYAVNPGDTLVMALEPNFYQCGLNNWTNWQLYNSLTWAWNVYPAGSPWEKISALVHGGTIQSPFDKIAAFLAYETGSAKIAPRLAALAPPKVIVARYESGQYRTLHFAYSPYNTDGHGDMQNTGGARYKDVAADVIEPNAICAYSKELLGPFIADMRSRGVRVLFEYFPYLVDGKPAPGWRAAEASFDADLASIGGTMIGTRNEFFFPRPMFFNTIHHLNSEGRVVATEVIIHDLQKFDAKANSAAPR